MQPPFFFLAAASVAGEDPEVEAEVLVVEVVGDSNGEGPMGGEGFARGYVEVEAEAAVSGVVGEGDRWMDHFVERDGDGLGCCGDGDLGGGGESGGPLVVFGVEAPGREVEGRLGGVDVIREVDGVGVVDESEGECVQGHPSPFSRCGGENFDALRALCSLRREYDQFFKSLANEDPRGILAMLGVLPLDAEAEVTPLDRELVREPVLIDQGYLVRQPGVGEWIAHIEAFSDVDQGDVERVLWYAARLALDTRLPVRSVILLLIERYAPKNGLSGEATVYRGSVAFHLKAEVVRMWEVPARKLLDTAHPKVISWVPLAQGDLPEWIEAARVLRDFKDAHLMGAFSVIGSLRYGKDVWEILLERGVLMIPSETLRKHSWLIQEWLEEGRQEGRQEGRVEGARDGALKILKDVLADRFPGLLEEEGLRLDSLSSGYAELNAAVRRLFRAERVEEAREILKGLQ